MLHHFSPTPLPLVMFRGRPERFLASYRLLEKRCWSTGRTVACSCLTSRPGGSSQVLRGPTYASETPKTSPRLGIALPCRAVTPVLLVKACALSAKVPSIGVNGSSDAPPSTWPPIRAIGDA